MNPVSACYTVPPVTFLLFTEKGGWLFSTIKNEILECFQKDAACLAISTTVDCSEHLHTLKKKIKKMNWSFSFFYVDKCMQSEVSSDGALYSNKILFIYVDQTTCNLSLI